MRSQFWLEFYHYISIFGYSLTIFFNVLLIILTGWFLEKKFGTYRILIIIFSVIGIVFNSLEIVLKPMVQSIGSGFLCFTFIETNRISKPILTQFLAFYIASFYISTSFLVVMFIHRYFSVAKPEQLFHFLGKRLTLWLSYSFFIGISTFFACTYLAEVDEFSKNYMEHEILEFYGRVIDEMPAIALIFYDSSSKIRFKSLSFLLICSFIVFHQNLIIIFCGVKIRQKLYSKTCNYSPSLQKLHKKFFKTLVFQVVTPTLLLFIPVMTILYLPLLGFETSLPIGILVCLFGFYPPIDSCIVMYIITEYRGAFRRFCGVLCGVRAWNEVREKMDLQVMRKNVT
ncbi:unnamed protein product [Caenorhabditis angaria]|uniref:Uncharacterized protein n=1 Tax=Caenorhabditis angaria TaxID=860376 RepID=A0A9P1NAD5_9PELO|nr:unnamed protein product [Caenorhabditis angaria]